MGKLIAPVVASGSMADFAQPEIVIDAELLLRPWQPTDVAAVIEAFSDADIQHWHFRRFDTETEASEWISSCAAGWSGEQRATWAIVKRAGAQIVGHVSIFTTLEDGYGEVSYWVLPDARGKGIATRACIAATQWAHRLGLNRVQLQHSTRNAASRRVALRSGYVEEGVRRGANLHADGWHDMKLYSHLATDPAPHPPTAAP